MRRYHSVESNNHCLRRNGVFELRTARLGAIARRPSTES